jgi:hypothetical protein
MLNSSCVYPCRHVFTSKLKWLFSVCVSKTVKFSHLLRATVLDIKNPSSIRNNSLAEFSGIARRIIW